jgi:hypothetical protein
MTSHQNAGQFESKIPDHNPGHMCPVCRQEVIEDERRDEDLAMMASQIASYCICLECWQGVPRALWDVHFREEWNAIFLERTGIV